MDEPPENPALEEELSREPVVHSEPPAGMVPMKCEQCGANFSVIVYNADTGQTFKVFECGHRERL